MGSIWKSHDVATSTVVSTGEKINDEIISHVFSSSESLVILYLYYQ